MESKKTRLFIRSHKVFCAVLAALAASITGVVVNHYLKGSAELQVTLFQSIPNPQHDSRVQFMVIESKGSKAAKEITVKITYPRIFEPLDFRIDTLDTLDQVTRTDSYLRFKIPRLPPGDYALAVFAIGMSEIEPKDVRIAYKQYTIPKEEINHVKLTYFKE